MTQSGQFETECGSSKDGPNSQACYDILNMSASSGDDPVVEWNPAGKSDDLTGRALRLRIRQQELLAELGVLALQGASFVEMLITQPG